MRLNLSLYFLCEINRVVSKYCSWSTVCKEMCFYSWIPFFHLAALLPAASASVCIFLITLPQRWEGLHTIQQSSWSTVSISAWHLPLGREVAWVCSALNLLFQHFPSQKLLRTCPSCQGNRALRTALHSQVISPKHNLPENLFWARWPAKVPSNLNQSLTNSGTGIKHCREVGNVALSYPHRKWNQIHISRRWPTEDLIALSKTLPSSLLTAVEMSQLSVSTSFRLYDSPLISRYRWRFWGSVSSWIWGDIWF